jgi:hypothetical protein
MWLVKTWLLRCLRPTVACVAGVWLVAALAAGGQGDVIRLKAPSGNSVEIKGESVPADKIGAKLKAAGVQPATRIEVLVGREASEADLSHLARGFASAGFRKIVFIREKHAEAFAPDPWKGKQ